MLIWAEFASSIPQVQKFIENACRFSPYCEKNMGKSVFFLK